MNSLTIKYTDLIDWNFKYYEDTKNLNLYMELPLKYLQKIIELKNNFRILIDELIDINMYSVHLKISKKNNFISLFLQSDEININNIITNKITLYGKENIWNIPLKNNIVSNIEQNKLKLHNNTNNKQIAIDINNKRISLEILKIGNSIDVLKSSLSEDKIKELYNIMSTNADDEFFLIEDTMKNIIFENLELKKHKRKLNVVFYKTISDKRDKLILGVNDLFFYSEEVFKIIKRQEVI